MDSAHEQRDLHELRAGACSRDRRLGVETMRAKSVILVRLPEPSNCNGFVRARGALILTDRFGRWGAGVDGQEGANSRHALFSIRCLPFPSDAPLVQKHLDRLVGVEAQNAICLDGAHRFIPSVFVGSEEIIPDRRSAVFRDDLQRPLGVFEAIDANLH